MEEPAKRRRLSSGSQTQDKKGEGGSSEAAKNDKNEGESSPARCPICLAPPENRAKSESCSHFFCFSCLKEWSKVKAECPLCKMPIRAIFYNIKSDSEYDEYQVKVPRPEPSSLQLLHNGMMMVESFDHWWHYRIRDYRAQVRRRHENELAAREASSNINAIRTRRMYYWNKTRVRHVETGNRVRDVSADFFRENPSQMHRLEPWLKRELTVLYGAHNRVLIRRVRDLIMSAVPVVGITSQRFINMIHPYMLEHTEQFVHEFVSFAKSPYDIHQYDTHTRYTTNREPEESHQWTSERWRRRMSGRNARRSRWDESPDGGERPGEPTSQSVMLSQTSWGDNISSIYPVVSAPDVGVSNSGRGGQRSETVGRYAVGDIPTPPGDFPVGISNPGFHYVGLLPARRRGFSSHRDIGHHVEAPLVHQTLDVHRHGGSSARDYQRMEVLRRHMGRHTRRREESRKRKPMAEVQPVPSARTNPQEIIVISSDSSDKEQGTSSGTYRNGSKAVLHYKPVTSQAENRQGRPKIKKERAAESSSNDSSDSSSTSDDSGVEFVKYIKPPHLRTPDVFIDLSSADDEAPGPSNRYNDIRKPNTKHTVTSSSSSSSLSESTNSSDEEKDPRRQKFSSTSSHQVKAQEILQRTKEFLQKAREATQRPIEVQSSTDTGEIDIITMPESSMMSSNDISESTNTYALENNTPQSDSAATAPADVVMSSAVAMMSPDNIVTSAVDSVTWPPIALPSVGLVASTDNEVIPGIMILSDEKATPSLTTVTSSADVVMSSVSAVISSESAPTLPEGLPTLSSIAVMSSETMVMSCKDHETGSGSSSQNALKSSPKKVFERGKVSVKLIKAKKSNFYGSDSDSEIDVGIEEIRPSGMYSRRSIIVENSPKIHEPSMSSRQILKEMPVMLSPASTLSLSGDSTVSKPERATSLSCDINVNQFKKSKFHELSKSSRKRHHHKRSSSHSPKRKRRERHKSRKSHKHSSRKYHEKEKTNFHDERGNHHDVYGGDDRLKYECSEKYDHVLGNHNDVTRENHKSKKSNKKLKHRRRSRSSSVEFVTHIHRI